MGWEWNAAGVWNSIYTYTTLTDQAVGMRRYGDVLWFQRCVMRSWSGSLEFRAGRDLAYFLG